MKLHIHWFRKYDEDERSLRYLGYRTKFVRCRCNAERVWYC